MDVTGTASEQYYYIIAIFPFGWEAATLPSKELGDEDYTIQTARSKWPDLKGQCRGGLGYDQLSENGAEYCRAHD